MNEKNDKQDFNPKHRIIGAIVLVTLAVIFIPFILSRDAGDEETGKDGDTKVVSVPVPVAGQPAEPQKAVEPPAARPAAKPEVPAEPLATAPLAVPPTPAAAPVEEKPGPVAAEPLPNEKPAASKTEQPAAKPAAKPAGKWYVQAGAFSQHENAIAASEKLRKLGLKTVVDTVTTKSGKLTRVRVGPYAEKAAASAALDKVRAQPGMSSATVVAPR
jgi:DedD protein